MNAAAYSASIDRIAIEVIHQAVLDIRSGNRNQKKEAADWLSSCGLAWCDVFGFKNEIENLLYNHNKQKGAHE